MQKKMTNGSNIDMELVEIAISNSNRKSKSKVNNSSHRASG